MSDEYGVHYRDNGTGWFVGVIVALALLAIAYLIFQANEFHLVQPGEVKCMIANPGKDCIEVTRWEPEAS
jgi:hypothetical protein